jgi:hypothetical protein
VPRTYVHRGLDIHAIPRLRKRDNRSIELFVDCYGDAEAAGAIQVYLADGLDYPFKAIWCNPDGGHLPVTVVALEEDWEDETGLMFLVDSDEGEEIVPAHQVFGTPSGRIATVLEDYRAWWPYDLVEADDEDDD